MPHTNNLTQEMQKCIDDCTECAARCTESVKHCLELGGKHAEPGHIATLLDCAEICQTSANSMLRNSEHHAIICEACADVCEACEQECRQFGDDDMMQECANACRKCATSCREMAAAA